MSNRSAGPVTTLARTAWGVWAMAMFFLSVLFALLIALLLPGRKLRGKVLAAAARAPFVLAAAPVKVVGRNNLPEGHSVVVANHASYVDGFLLKGYLPARFSFVIKGEMRDIPIVHFLLRRAGSRFVERFERAGSARDARSIVRAAQGGESLAFFAEGTFREEPGLARFRPGAFVAAVKGRMPVVPVAISGTRQMMPGGLRIPKPAPLTIRILPAILPDAPEFQNHRDLAEAARQRVLAVLDEPDLLDADASRPVARRTEKHPQ